jgi:hypothetical protein
MKRKNKSISHEGVVGAGNVPQISRPSGGD